MLRINRKMTDNCIENRAVNAPARVTINGLKNRPVYYPDHPTVKWQDVLKGGISASSLSDSILDIAVVGRGASALAVMSELADIAKTHGNVTINVTNYFFDPEVGEDPNITYENKWGRIFTASPGVNLQEIGCMRFPEIAVLTWNFINKIYPESGDTDLIAFPNPGVVPTQFLFRDMNVIFQDDQQGTPTAIVDMNSETQSANLDVMEYIRIGVLTHLLNSVSDSAGHNVSYFVNQLIGNNDNPPPVDGDPAHAQKVWREWYAFADELDVPLVNLVQEAIRLILENDPPADPTGLRDEHYYLELFGRYGFGTGGFRALNNVTFTDIARILIWDYANEYLFPGNPGDSTVGNNQFAQDFHTYIQNAADTLDNFNLTSKISEVMHAGRQDDGSIALTHWEDGALSTTRSSHAYCVLCLPHHAAQKITEVYSGLPADVTPPAGSKYTYTNGNGLSDTVLIDDLKSPLDLVEGGMGTIYSGMKRAHMMRSTKYFADIKTDAYRAVAPTSASDPSKFVKMVISDTDFAASYFLDGQEGTTNVLISYTWGDEASNASSQLRGLTETAGSASNDTLALRYAEAGNRAVLDNVAENADDGNFWLSNLLGSDASPTGYMYDWSQDRSSRGGFKLDWVSEVEVSRALYNHYRDSVLAAEDAASYSQTCFIAGDSFSHLGGWLEGAFMTGLNAVAGVMRSHYGAEGLSDAGNLMFVTPQQAVKQAVGQAAE